MKIRLIFIVYVTLVIGVVLLGFGTAFLTSEKRHEQAALSTKKQQVILQLANVCERAFYENGLIFEGFRNGLKQEIGYFSSACLDTDGNEMKFDQGRPLKTQNRGQSQIDPNLFFQDNIILPNGNKGEEIVAPLMFGGQQAGFAKIVFDLNQIEAHLLSKQWRTFRQLMLLGIFPLLLSFVGVFGFLKALERLRELDEKKKELINSVTHEFRSPLTAIQSFCGLALKGVYGSMKPDLHEALSIIRNNSLRLSQFVDDLLALAAFEPKNERLFIEEFDAVDLIRSLEKTYTPLADEKKIELKIVFSSPTLEVKTDRAKVLQILENLISNAIKYTEKGCVEIGAEKSDGRLTLFVKDSGIGISKEDRGSIFEPFFRSEKHARSVKGAGLGLAIVKAYAAQLKADLNVESELGKGSKFSLTLERAA